ncbi:hypothetical protein ASPFODRAFT_127852, partial [Aspergillus luchuensis CBS 106.47]
NRSNRQEIMHRNGYSRNPSSRSGALAGKRVAVARNPRVNWASMTGPDRLGGGISILRSIRIGCRHSVIFVVRAIQYFPRKLEHN